MPFLKQGHARAGTPRQELTVSRIGDGIDILMSQARLSAERVVQNLGNSPHGA
jgi:hypothetical protein